MLYIYIEGSLYFMNENEKNNNKIQTQVANETISPVLSVIFSFITSAIILAITAFFTPGFTIANAWALVLATTVLTVADYLLVSFTGIKASALGRGVLGFCLAVALLYFTQYFIAGYSISVLSAIIGAIIYGVVDFFIA